ncbi:hypothetical protein GQ44DRAFT_635919, partial [Phaeosphaeriaceae sp. PMI808]
YRISPTIKVEDAEQYQVGGLHPVHIRDDLKKGRYRIFRKLSFGSFSSFWLAPGFENQRYVSFKVAPPVFQGESNETEISSYLSALDGGHEGR